MFRKFSGLDSIGLAMVVEQWHGNLDGDHVVDYTECRSEVFLFLIQ